MNVRIDLNEPKILAKVQNDRFGLLVSHEWRILIDPYVPRATGMLMADVEYKDKLEEKPFSLHYKVPYASAVYYNTRGVKFVTKGEGRNPSATDHWDIKAAKSGQLDKLYRTLNNALQSGQY
jgi:hypothetical protein